MDAATINRLIRGLGSTYQALLAEGLIQGTSLVPPFNDGESEDLILKLTPGIELWFQAETKILKRIGITLKALVERDTIYTGELPTPFTFPMDQAGIHALLGEPYRCRGPAKLPPPIGVTGGWDAYRLGKSVHPDAEVAIQFLEDRSVSGLAFRLINH